MASNIDDLFEARFKAAPRPTPAQNPVDALFDAHASATKVPELSTPAQPGELRTTFKPGPAWNGKTLPHVYGGTGGEQPDNAVPSAPKHRTADFTDGLVVGAGQGLTGGFIDEGRSALSALVPGADDREQAYGEQKPTTISKTAFGPNGAATTTSKTTQGVQLAPDAAPGYTERYNRDLAINRRDRDLTKKEAPAGYGTGHGIGTVGRVVGAAALAGPGMVPAMLGAQGMLSAVGHSDAPLLDPRTVDAANEAALADTAFGAAAGAYPVATGVAGMGLGAKTVLDPHADAADKVEAAGGIALAGLGTGGALISKARNNAANHFDRIGNESLERAQAGIQSEVDAKAGPQYGAAKAEATEAARGPGLVKEKQAESMSRRQGRLEAWKQRLVDTVEARKQRAAEADKNVGTVQEQTKADYKNALTAAEEAKAKATESHRNAVWEKINDFVDNDERINVDEPHAAAREEFANAEKEQLKKHQAYEKALESIGKEKMSAKEKADKAFLSQNRKVADAEVKDTQGKWKQYDKALAEEAKPKPPPPAPEDLAAQAESKFGTESKQFYADQRLMHGSEIAVPPESQAALQKYLAEDIQARNKAYADKLEAAGGKAGRIQQLTAELQAQADAAAKAGPQKPAAPVDPMEAVPPERRAELRKQLGLPEDVESDSGLFKPTGAHHRIEEVGTGRHPSSFVASGERRALLKQHGLDEQPSNYDREALGEKIFNKHGFGTGLWEKGEYTPQHRPIIGVEDEHANGTPEWNPHDEDVRLNPLPGFERKTYEQPPKFKEQLNAAESALEEAELDLASLKENPDAFGRSAIRAAEKKREAAAAAVERVRGKGAKADAALEQHKTNAADPEYFDSVARREAYRNALGRMETANQSKAGAQSRLQSLLDSMSPEAIRAEGAQRQSAAARKVPAGGLTAKALEYGKRVMGVPNGEAVNDDFARAYWANKMAERMGTDRSFVEKLPARFGALEQAMSTDPKDDEATRARKAKQGK